MTLEMVGLKVFPAFAFQPPRGDSFYESFALLAQLYLGRPGLTPHDIRLAAVQSISDISAMPERLVHLLARWQRLQALEKGIVLDEQTAAVRAVKAVRSRLLTAPEAPARAGWADWSCLVVVAFHYQTTIFMHDRKEGHTVIGNLYLKTGWDQVDVFSTGKDGKEGQYFPCIRKDGWQPFDYPPEPIRSASPPPEPPSDSDSSDTSRSSHDDPGSSEDEYREYVRVMGNARCKAAVGIR